MAGEHLEQPDVVLVELVEPELRHDDHAHDAGAVAQRHRQQRLLDHGRARHLAAELAVGGVADQERLAGRRAPPGDAFADAGAKELEWNCRDLGGELASERDWHEHLAVHDEDPTVVVIDERPKLGCDLVADLAHVVEPVQLPAQTLQHLHVRDRANVARIDARMRPLDLALVVEDDPVLPARLRGHHRRFGACGQLAWVHRVLRPQ